MPHRFDFIAMHPETLVDEEALEAIIGDYVRALHAVGGHHLPADVSPDPTTPVFLLVATGGSERIILDWWDRNRLELKGQPLWLIAHPGNNSLPAALEVLARLHQDGAPGRIFYLESPDDASGIEEIVDSVHDVAVRKALGQARIGVVGAPSDWLVASMPDAATLRRAWGPTLVPVEMHQLVEEFHSADDAGLEPYLVDLKAKATDIREPLDSDLRDGARVYLALKRIVADNDLDALTVRCFDLVLNQKTTGCFALAQLTDDGTIAGCEGDLMSTVGMLWIQKLLGATPWMANPAQLDPRRDTLWLAHCTVPRTLVNSYVLRSHFESGLGIGIQGALPAGPVTLLRIGGGEMDRLWIAEGEIARTGTAENLCRTQAEVRLTGGGTVDDLLHAPLGNHLVLVSGHHRQRLLRWRHQDLRCSPASGNDDDSSAKPFSPPE